MTTPRTLKELINKVYKNIISISGAKKQKQKQERKHEYSRKSRFAPISSISSIILGGIIAIVSTFSFFVDIITTRNPIALILDLTVMAISYLTVWQGFYYTIVERVAREKMEDAFDYKVEPIVRLLTETATKINALEENVLKTNLKVDTTLEYVMKSQNMDVSKAYILPGISFQFISKILVLIFFTFSSLVYVSVYPLGIVHYFIMVLYLVWWGFITAEYKLFGNTVAWVWGIAPIMVIPSVGIIMSAIYGLNIMIGVMFIVLLFYVYSYYTWACYVRTGYKMIDLKAVMYLIKKRLKKSNEPELNINSDEFRRLIK